MLASTLSISTYKNAHTADMLSLIRVKGIQKCCFQHYWDKITYKQLISKNQPYIPHDL